jgi:hypothetical protein
MEDDLLDLLERRVDTLSEERFVRVFTLLDELEGHPAALSVYERARPRLKRVRPPRRPTLQRAFCLPFEDLLVDTRTGGRMTDATVRRIVMRATWAWLAQHPGFEHDAFAARLRRIPPQDHEGLDALGRDLWQAGAQVLSRALGRAPDPSDGTERLFGPDGTWHEDVAQIARTLDMGSAIEGLKRTLPSAPIRAVDAECAHIIRRAVIANARGDAGRAFAIISAMLARVSPPALLLERISTLDLGLPAQERAELMRWLSAPLAFDLVARLTAVDTGAGTDALARATALRDLAAALEATESAFAATNADRGMRTRVSAIRSEICRGLDTTLDDARGAVERIARDGAADLSELVEAEHALLALKTCAPVAARFDRGQVFDEALTEVASGARTEIAALVDALPNVAADEADDARARLFRAVRLIELAASPGEADAARRAALQALKQNGF